MNTEQIIKLAREAGGTTYTNRFYPNETAVAFSNGALGRFVDAILSSSHTTKPAHGIALESGEFVPAEKIADWSQQ